MQETSQLLGRRQRPGGWYQEAGMVGLTGSWSLSDSLFFVALTDLHYFLIHSKVGFIEAGLVILQQLEKETS
jgi:hypothetical protein